MLSPVEIGALCTASFGSVALIWGNIKGVFARVESLVIVKFTVVGNVQNDIMDYLWANFKASTFGVRAFGSDDKFIKPKNRFGRVGIEHPGSFITFWMGWKPIFVSNDKTNTISFIRGTFDLEKLIIDAVNFYDKNKHEKKENGYRYYVRRCFGKKISRNTHNGEDAKEQPVALESSKCESNGFGWRPLFWSREDLGPPTSKDPMGNLAYGEAVTEFYEECLRWKESKDWFKGKGLPWRLGAGLFGPPGTGKSSLARALGQALDMPIHSYDLTTMDNQELVENWQSSLGESPCIVLLEDIDRIFNDKKEIKTANDKAPLTLDCLLNCISGVNPADGILVLVTANDVTKLDPALGVPDETGKSTRPGRLDRALYVGALTSEGRYKIANRILADATHLIEEVVQESDGDTGAQFEAKCSRLALDQYWGKFKTYGDKHQIDVSKLSSMTWVVEQNFGKKND